MADKKFAFESEKITIAFSIYNGMGDAIIEKKVLGAVITLAPDCLVDVFCLKKKHELFAKAFYSDFENLNLIASLEGLDWGEFYKKVLPKYDFAFSVGGSHVIILDYVNSKRLQTMSPKLFDAIVKINEYNKPNFYEVGSWGTSVAFRNMMMARILNKNCYEFLSCNGALPICDNKVAIPLLPKYKSKFDALKLDRYITIYSNIAETERDKPKVKTWSIRYWYEYVARLKKRLPQIEIVQCGGGNDIKIENADRHFLGCDLELTKYILANSLLHVGCEGGLVHLATQLGTKCLVLFGSSGVEYFGYKQNINLVSEVCQPCMYILPDFSICLRGAKEPPCMLSHTPQTVCEITCNYLKNKA